MAGDGCLQSDSQKIKVLFVSHSSQLYGAERSLFTLVKGLKNAGGVLPAVLLPGKGPLVDLMRAERITVIVKPYFPWIGKNCLNRTFLGPVRLLFNVITTVSLHQTIYTLQPDVVYSNTLATPLGAIISQWHRIPHIWHAREFVQEDLGKDFDWGWNLSTRLLSRAAAIICNSSAVRRKLRRFIHKNTFKVIYNGFEFNPEPLPDPTVKFKQPAATSATAKIMIIGNVHPGKGHADAIRALGLLLSEGFRVELDVLGSGNTQYRRYLQTLAARLSIDAKINWLGFVRDPLPRLAEAAVLFACSRSEAFGRVAVEAMALGTPVIGTASGGLPEIITNGVTGFLYPPGDAAALASQAALLLGNHRLYTEIASRGRQSVLKRFGARRYVAEVESALHAVLEKCATSRQPSAAPSPCHF